MTPSAPAERTNDASLARFWWPRYWPWWLLYLWMRAMVHLPFRWQIGIGKRLGRLLGAFATRAARTARRNLEVCFPELAPSEREQLLRRHFEAIGASVLETPLGWFAPIERLRKLVRVEGREHLEHALQEDRPVILFMAHFTTLEICGALLQDLAPGCSFLYRPQRNAFVESVIRRGRGRYATEQIPRDNVRALLRVLRRKGVVAYIPDQTHVGNQSALLPFFGEPAVTNIVTSKLARISGALVLPFFFRRLPDDSGYVINLAPPLDDFPTADPIDDTRRLNQLLEKYIRLAPEQYLWTYKKFKRRPSPYPDLYRATRTEA